MRNKIHMIGGLLAILVASACSGSGGRSNKGWVTIERLFSGPRSGESQLAEERRYLLPSISRWMCGACRYQATCRSGRLSLMRTD